MNERGWYVNAKGKAIGPFTYSELASKVSLGEMKGNDLAYFEGAGQWKKAYLWEDLASLFEDQSAPVVGSDSVVPTKSKPSTPLPFQSPTQSPSRSDESAGADEAEFTRTDKSDFTKTDDSTDTGRTVEAGKAKSVVTDDDKTMELESPVQELPVLKWVVLVRDEQEMRFRQQGPLSTDQVKELLQGGKLKPTDHIWQKGAPKWTPIHEIADFHVNQIKLNSEVQATLARVEQMPPEAPPATLPKKQPPSDLTQILSDRTRVLIPSGAGGAQPKTLASQITINETVDAEILPEHTAIGQSLAPPKAAGKAAAGLPKEIPDLARIANASPRSEALGVDQKSQSAQSSQTSKTGSNRIQIDVSRRGELESVTDSENESLRKEGRRERPSVFAQAAMPVLGIVAVILAGVGGWVIYQKGKTIESEKPPTEVFRPVAVPASPSSPPRQVIAVPNPPRPSQPNEAKSADRSLPEPQPVVKAPQLAVARPQPAERKIPDNTSPGLRFNTETEHLEIGGGFRQADILKVRIDGKAGHVVDLPALVVKREVRAMRDDFHRVPLSDLKLPKGEYAVQVSWGSQKLQRQLVLGSGIGKIADLVNQNRKKFAYDQQQEKKRLIRAVRDFSQILAQAESEGRTPGGAEKINRVLRSKEPAEFRALDQSRYQLIYSEAWEKLASNWEGVAQQLRESGSRGPASSREITRARREAASIESDVRNRSIWEQ